MKVKHYSITSKFRRLMRICAAQAMIAFILCGIAMANTGYSQLLDKEITISLKNVTLETALMELGKIAEVKFAYSLDQMNVKVRVSVEADRTPLGKVLDELLTPHNIRYKISDRELTIFLKRDNEKGSRQSFDSRSDNVRYYQVTGRVTDVNAQPMAGVNVLVKGTTNGTSSDTEGKYAINVGSDDDILVFSFIGYTSAEVKVNSQATIDVILIEDVNTLGEVVVNAGYWQVNERENTGSIVKLSANEIADQPVTNFLQAMQGRLTGVYITQTSGTPGSNFSVQIRGRNSIAAGNAPLYIIDGIPFSSTTLSSTSTSGVIYGGDGSSPLNIIAPENIESIEVLKDADATAVYGSRGANGVILITTKKGKSKNTGISLNIGRGFSAVANNVELMNTGQYVEMRKEAFRNDNATPNATNAPDLTRWDTTRYTDWQKELIGGKAVFTNVSASLSGGTKDTQFIFNNAYQKQGSVMPGDFYFQRASSQLSLNNASFNDKLKSNVSITYSIERNEATNQDLTATALQLAPNAPALFDDEGNLNWENSTWTNPLNYLKQPFRSASNNLIASSIFAFAILPDLEAKSSFSLTRTNFREQILTPAAFRDPASNPTSENSTNTLATSVAQSWIIEPQITYTKRIGKTQLNLLVGATFQSSEREQLVQTGRGFPSDALIEDINAATVVDVGTFNATQYRYSAAFGRINYSYAQKYFVNLTGRRDGSSRFGPGKQFANFMAAGLAWVFSREGFVSDNLPFLSFGKLRASYGTTGNDQIADYGFLNTYGSFSSYQGVTGLNPTRLFNPEYAWEINRKFEVGLETGFLNDQVLFDVNFYLNRSSNQLVGYPLPLTTGFNSIQANLAATVENTGWEFELRTENLKATSLKWTTSVILTVPRNKLIAFPGLETSTYASRYVVGEPLSVSKRYHLIGVNPETGIYQFEDMNRDGSITSADRLHTITLGQLYFGGITNSLSYKGFRLDFLFQAVNQRGIGYQGLMSSYPGRVQQPASILGQQWNSAGENASVQRFTNSNSTVSTAQTRYRESDAVIRDASFVRLKNASLSYQFPAAMLKGVQCRLYVLGQNLITFTDYDGFDPETMSLALPPLRTITIGIDVTL